MGTDLASSLQALRPRVDAPSDDAHSLWQLPDWDAYSTHSSLSTSQPLARSEGSSDGDDGESSLAASISASSSSSSSVCVGVQRSLVALTNVRVGASAAKRQSALRQLHQRYAQQRQAAALGPATGGDAAAPSQQQQSGDDAAAQWLALLSHKVELLAAICGHDGSRSLKASDAQEQQQLRAELEAWRAGDAAVWQSQVAPRVAETTRTLERALAELSVAVERSSRRKLEQFEAALAQMQALHRETLQRVASESAEKLQLARSKRRAQREQLEGQLRAASRAADEWELRAAELERKSTLEREKVESQAATFRDKFEKLSVRFDEDIERITEQLEAARRDKRDALSDRDSANEQLEALKQELARSQEQFRALAATHQLVSNELEQEKQRVERLRRENDAVVDEVQLLSRGKQELADLLEHTKRQRAVEVETLQNRFGMRAEDDYRAAVMMSEEIVELQRQHEKQLEAMRTTYEQRVEEQGRAVEKALEEQGKKTSSSPRFTSSDPNDTVFTDVNTTMPNETWDQSSLTSSTDTFNRMSPYQPLSRPQSAGSSNTLRSGVDNVPSNEDILALVRKLESYTASAASSLHEPESEQNTLYRTPESRATTRKSQPPPVHRTGGARTEAARAARRPHKPSTLLTSRPLRSSLASGSSLSSASPSSNQRHKGLAARSSSASTKRSAPRIAPFY